MTEEQIQQVNEAFVSEIYDEEGKLVAVNLASCFFTSEYNKPEELNLADFLRYCPMGVDAPQEERNAAMAALGREQSGGTCRKFEKSQVDEALMKWMDITSDGLNLDGTYGTDPVYLEEYDAYYNFVSDFSPGFFDCTGGEICGDTVYLYSPGATLTLVQRAGVWYIYSHVVGDPMMVQHG